VFADVNQQARCQNQIGQRMDERPAMARPGSTSISKSLFDDLHRSEAARVRAVPRQAAKLISENTPEVIVERRKLRPNQKQNQENTAA
jgi:hypothetical protein